MAYQSHAHETQIAHEAWPLKHKLSPGNPPPLVASFKDIGVVPVQIHHGADRVRVAEKTGLEVGGGVGAGPVAVDVDDGGAEEVLGVDVCD